MSTYVSDPTTNAILEELDGELVTMNPYLEDSALVRSLGTADIRNTGDALIVRDAKDEAFEMLHDLSEDYNPEPDSECTTDLDEGYPYWPR